MVGSNFINGCTVTFGGVGATSVTFSNATLVTAFSPPHAPGTVDVVLTDPDTQVATKAASFTYVLPPAAARFTSGKTVNGTNLVLISSGATNGTSWLLTSTNVALAKASWTPLATNPVGANGLATNTVPIKATERARFYMLSIP